MAKNVLEVLCGVGYIPTYSVKNIDSAQWVLEELTEKKPEIILVLTENMDALQQIAAKNPDMIVGAGNILNAEACTAAFNAGAGFVVSPCFDAEIAKAAKDALYIPICQTFAEMTAAQKAGIHTVGYYPCMAGGAGSLDIVARHFPDLKLVVMGESTVSSMGDIIAKTCVSALGIFRGMPDGADFVSAESFYKNAEDAVTGYETWHIGINTPSSEDAFALASELNALLGLPIKKGPTGNFFVGTDIEVMKSYYRGTNGHIAIRTNKVPCAMYRFAKKGYKWDMDTAWPLEDGSILTVYLDVNTEFGGFAVHLLKKS
jgi:2-dehydro-3-deoxyphosphogluconate aldolase/(4S)-4-hydroxy-2-oxoglutarate aldolase